MHSAQFQLHADIELRHWWFVGRRRIMRRVVEAVLPPDKRATVIDVGCGTGANVAELADAYRCVGIDTSAEAIALARQRFPAVEFLSGFAPADLGQRMQEARLVMLMDVLEHVPDDFELLSSLLSAASPGCLFLVTVPADETLWSPHDEAFGHYRRYDADRLARVWQGLPVETLLLSYFNARLLPVIRWMRRRAERRGEAAGAAGTDFWIPARPANSLLTAFLAGESGRLVKTLRGAIRGYSAGASLMAVLRRGDGNIPVRKKPADLPPDHRL